MRLEWLPIVRQHDWHKFEIMAAEEPTWLLYETIRELAEGMPEREDRFRLGNILKTLEASGYGTDGTPESEELASYRPTHPYRMALITEANELGAQFMYLMFVRNDKLITFSMTDLTAHDFYMVTATERPFNRRPLNRAFVKKNVPTSHKFIREIPFEYLCLRINHIIGTKNTISEITPLLKSLLKPIFKYSVNGPHPTDMYETPEMSDEDMVAIVRSHSVTKEWQIPVPRESICLDELNRVTLDLRMSVDARAERRYELLMENVDSIVSNHDFIDLSHRFRDLGYLLAQQNDWEMALKMVAIGRHILDNKLESAPFIYLMKHTAKVMPKHLSEENMRLEREKAA